jgi:hypothetical protein
MTHGTTPTSQARDAEPAKSPLASPIILTLLSAAHLAYLPLAELRGISVLLPALGAALLLGAGYAIVAWLARRGRGFRPAVYLIVGEDLGFLSAGLLIGYRWAQYLRPGTVVIMALQLALAFAEIVRRQEASRPIVPATRLAWFVLAYALAYSVWAILKPAGFWSLG